MRSATKKLLLLTSVISATMRLLPAAYYLNEDFSTYNEGDLVGQNGWAQYGSPTSNPIQITGGKMVMTGNTQDNQDAQKAFTITASPGSTFYFGYSVQVLGAGNNGATFTSSYVSALLDGAPSPGPFADARIGFYTIDEFTYQVAARVNGQSSNPFNNSPQIFNYGTDTLNLIFEWTFGDGATTFDTLAAYVNPDSVLATPDLLLENAGTPISGGFNQFILSQFTFSPELAMDKLVVSDTFSEAYFAVIPEPATCLLLALGFGLIAFRLRRAKAV